MSDTVTFKLNGKDVTVPKGWTVMQAASREEVSIPHFCWHPGLEIAGVCRFCMVEVKGRPKLEIACNLPATDGLEVNTQTDQVKDAHKWALEFHLVNHPLDCPVCDQAGECGLQDYYMEVGQYKSQMTRPKVLKPKALDVGSRLVLDTERCILCSRCVRFEEEVTKTNGLGIYDRGDRAIIGTYGEEKIKHEYQENIVDICPVGAFTSKKFRFKQRVWFLKEKESICPGCSTGCHISVHGRPERRQYFRVKPREAQQINGHWMCDKGRDVIEHLNPENRLNYAWYVNKQSLRVPGDVATGLENLASVISKTQASQIALLVSAQYTNEEYKTLFAFFVQTLGVKHVYQWRESSEERDLFDGILLRGDHNANTQGLLQALEAEGFNKTVKNELDDCLASSCKVIIALSPEIPWTHPSLPRDLEALAQKDFVSLWTCHQWATEVDRISQLIPMKGFTEKTGTFINHQGKPGVLDGKWPSSVENAVDVLEVIESLKKHLLISKD